MKNIKFIILSITILFAGQTLGASIYDFTVSTPKGESILLKQYIDKPILVINIATRCGYTGQLDDIEKLYKKYQEKGLRVIGIPSNDFGGQTPESDKEVVEMCRVKYGASFPISTKSIVTGKTKIPLIEFILSSSDSKEIQWNFEKFLFNKKGKFIKRFDSATLPLGSDLELEIKKLL